MKYLIHILITINQKAFRLGLEVQCKVSFHSMISDPRIHARVGGGGGGRGQNLVHLQNVVLNPYLDNNLLEIIQTWTIGTQ